MQLLQHLHTHHIMFSVVALVQMIFTFAKWDWISRALSDKGDPSSTRLMAFLFGEGIILWETWHVFKTKAFDTTHLLYMLVMIGVLFGFVKVADIISFIRGGNAQAPAKSEQPESKAA